jgi:hypothetical protein
MKTNGTLRRFIGFFSAAAMLAVAGCVSTWSERITGQDLSDKMLIGRVNRALADQPVYKFPDVTVNTFRDVVQLSGFVANEQQKEVAAEIARRVRGVAEVRNDITIAPLAPSERNRVREHIPGREDSAEGAYTNRLIRGTGAVPSGR